MGNSHRIPKTNVYVLILGGTYIELNEVTVEYIQSSKFSCRVKSNN